MEEESKTSIFPMTEEEIESIREASLARSKVRDEKFRLQKNCAEQWDALDDVSWKLILASTMLAALRIAFPCAPSSILPVMDLWKLVLNGIDPEIDAWNTQRLSAENIARDGCASAKEKAAWRTAAWASEAGAKPVKSLLAKIAIQKANMAAAQCAAEIDPEYIKAKDEEEEARRTLQRAGVRRQQVGWQVKESVIDEIDAVSIKLTEAIHARH